MGIGSGNPALNTMSLVEFKIMHSLSPRDLFVHMLLLLLLNSKNAFNKEI